MKITDKMLEEVQYGITKANHRIYLEESELRTILEVAFAVVPVGLRDKLAAHALAGLTSNANLIEHLNAGDSPLNEKAFLASITRGAYLYADAMLEARK